MKNIINSENNCEKEERPYQREAIDEMMYFTMNWLRGSKLTKQELEKFTQLFQKKMNNDFCFLWLLDHEKLWQSQIF